MSTWILLVQIRGDSQGSPARSGTAAVPLSSSLSLSSLVTITLVEPVPFIARDHWLHSGPRLLSMPS
eukprot:4766168-Pleurochrysis_carterae.AAC.5